jgi:ribonuclease D
VSHQTIADPAALSDLVKVLEGAPTFALDTEGNSFHAYRDRVCLLQIAVGSGDAQAPRIFLVDPLAVDPRPLGPVFVDPARRVVVHGGDYDVRSLRRDFGFQFGRMFDTMLAAQTLHLPELGLAALLRTELGVTIAKGEQRSDWGRRPLRSEQLAYAAEDVHHLLPLAAILEARLAQAGRVEAAHTQFEKLRHLAAREKPFDVEGWRRMKGARELDPKQQGILRLLWNGRDRLCREMDRAPFKLVGEQAMVEIARRSPRTAGELRDVPGVSALLVQKLGPEIIAACAQESVASEGEESR